MKINLDYKNDFQIDFINYKKPKNALAKLFIDLKIKMAYLILIILILQRKKLYKNKRFEC